MVTCGDHRDDQQIDDDSAAMVEDGKTGKEGYVVAKGSKGTIGMFDPPQYAEPERMKTAEQGAVEAETPTVLTKLQKWADYQSIGEPVGPTKFLPMKTPMSLEIIENWSLESPPLYRLTVPDLIASQNEKGRRVGMIIDLANHDCLYADDLPDCIEYAHVQLIAKVLPPIEAIDDVQRVAQDFWTRKPDDFIAIHCAYGFNRTGFVVCSYLCQALGMTVEQALEVFAEARPPGVKHGKFVDELYARYGETSELTNLFNDDKDARNNENEVRNGNEQYLPATPDYSPFSRSMRRDEVTKSAPSSVHERQSSSADGMVTQQMTRSNSCGALESSEEELTHMANSLNFSSMMRRETSMGLAKALHVDFGHHDHVPDVKKHPAPEPVHPEVHFQTAGGEETGDECKKSILGTSGRCYSDNPSLEFSQSEALLKLRMENSMSSMEYPERNASMELQKSCPPKDNATQESSRPPRMSGRKGKLHCSIM